MITGIVILLVLLNVVTLVMLNMEHTRRQHAEALIDWADRRETKLVPLVRCVAAIHYGGAPEHSVAEIDGVHTTVEVPVPDVDPKALPEGKNWVVRGDTVYEQRQTKIPSRGGMDQVYLLMEMERERRALIQPLREAWKELADWEQENPVPGSSPTKAQVMP